jgi:hypothetical protein
MPGLPQRSSGRHGSLTGNLRLPLVLAGLATLSGCILFGHPRFDAEVKALKAEAAQMFPLGSDAAEFEAWFSDRAGHKKPSPLKVGYGKQCEMRILTFGRAEGCVNQLFANYCVDDAGKLKSLEFKDGGYC